MTSLITNVSAMTALQTLQSTNSALEKTQSRISTGFRVAEAKDNAAYWSIATTMRSDNDAMSAVSDSLGIGSATVDTAYTGLSSAKDVLDQIKAKLTTATSDGVDRSKVQAEITALQEQLRTIADSASFSGQNWLSTGDSASFDKEIVSSLSRDINGAISVGSISVDISDMRLFGDGVTRFGLIDKTINLTSYKREPGAPPTVDTDAIAFTAATDKVTFSISQNGAAARTVEITQSTLTKAGLSDFTIRSTADLVTVYKQALKDAGIDGISVAFDTADTMVDSTGTTVANTTDNQIVFSSLEQFTFSAAVVTGTDAGGITDFGLPAASADVVQVGAGATSVADIDISGMSSTDIRNYMRVVDEALSQVTTAASDLGAIQNRVQMQKDFVSKLMDTIDKGVGTLVDADMTEESTRLKALQTQQQLGVQALSIANQTSQSILQLFQN